MNKIAHYQQTITHSQETSIWEVLKYAFQIFLHDMQHWFLFNLSFLGYALGILTIPAAKASLTFAIWKGLEDVDAIKKEDARQMRAILKPAFGKSIQLCLLKTLAYAVIGFSIIFWISRPEWALRSLAILAIYGALLVWMTSFYLYPVLVEDLNRSVAEVCKIAFKKAVASPFEGLLFSALDFVLLLLEVVLCGPLMVVLPSLRKILAVLAYWFVSGREVPMAVREFQGFKFLKPK